MVESTAYDAEQQSQNLDPILGRIRAKLNGGDETAATPGQEPSIAELLEHIRLQLEEQGAKPETYELSQIQSEIEAAMVGHRQTGQINPRMPGVHNAGAQFLKKLIRRSLTWYTRPIHLFQGGVVRALRHAHFVLQTHDSELLAQADAIRAQADAMQRIIEQNKRLAERVTAMNSELREQHDKLATRMQVLLSGGVGGAGKSSLLRENDRIVAYWDNAAVTDPMRETVSQGVDESDEEYLQNWSSVGEYVASKIMSYSPPDPVALEIGPGMGRITIPMSRYCRSITALDISPEMTAQAKQAMAELPNFEVHVITDEDLSFLPSEHFDLAYAISCFQHAEKKSFYRYLKGMRRALKPGGVLFFGVLNLCTDRGWGHFSAIVRNDYPEFFHTPDEVSCYLERAGYSSHRFAYEGETLWAIARR